MKGVRIDHDQRCEVGLAIEDVALIVVAAVAAVVVVVVMTSGQEGRVESLLGRFHCHSRDLDLGHGHGRRCSWNLGFRCSRNY